MIGLVTGSGGGGRDDDHRRRRSHDDDDEDVEEQLLLSEIDGFGQNGGGGGVNGSGKMDGVRFVRRPFWTSLHVDRSTARIAVVFILACVLWAAFMIIPSKRGIMSEDGRTLLPKHWTLSKAERSAQQLAKWHVPKDTKVVALVFYGRRRTASVLSCYLERNLKRNGGVLDEVVWLQGTTRVDDVAWMMDVANVTDGYSTFYNEKYATKQHYPSAYSVVFTEQHEGPVVYVKIDDDIVFLEDVAITSLVHRLLTDPGRPFIVGANVVNQAALSWVHNSIGAVDAYLPELEEPPAPPPGKSSGRHPEPLYWSGPADYKVPRDFKSPKPKGNRWLPLRPGESIDKTPIAQNNIFDPFGSGLNWWPVGAQQHYSLLGKLARNDIRALKYDFWDFNYVRMGIQFFAIRREDIVENFPLTNPDDEHHLSVTLPAEKHRHGIVDGRNVVAHYSYGPQYVNMETTDVFARYRQFAQDNICYTLDALQRAAEPNSTWID